MAIGKHLATAGMSAALLAGCGGHHLAVGGAPPQRPWREVATADDRKRLRDWRISWVAAVNKARQSGHGSEIDREGTLLQPDIGLTDPVPPVGEYRCRTLKIGAKTPGLSDYASYPGALCRIGLREERLRFTKLDGVQRPVGTLYPDDGQRAVFLGTMVLGDEHKALGYSNDRDRDMAGFVQRIGERTWRIAFPAPHWESTLDVIELTPAG